MKRILSCLLCTCALSVSVSAHVLDEYLQAAQITIAVNAVGVELRLTPGVNVAERVVALIDIDRSGQISEVEEQAYAKRVLNDSSSLSRISHISKKILRIGTNREEELHVLCFRTHVRFG